MNTERLILRRWKTTDLDAFAEMSADSTVMEYFPDRLDREESRQFIERVEQKFEHQGFGFWAVELKSTGVFIGFTGLNIPTFDAAFTPCVEIGWRLGREHWGKGYATEAAKCCLDFAFNKAGIAEVLSWTYRGNQRSRNVMARIGMTHDPRDVFDHPQLPADSPLKHHVLYRLKRGAFVLNADQGDLQ